MIHVLLIDDEFLARNAVRLLLTQPQCPPCSIREACDGAEAQLRIAEAVPDLALIDVSMPIMGGLELLAWIQEHHPGIRCVMLSSYSDFEYVREAMKSGAFDYLLKHQLSLQCVLDLLGQIGHGAVTDAPIPDAREKQLKDFLTSGQEEAVEWMRDCAFFCSAPDLPETVSTEHLRSILKTCRHILAEAQATLCLAPGQVMVFLLPREAKESASQHIQRAARLQTLMGDAILRYYNTQMCFQKPARCDHLAHVRNQYLYLLVPSAGAKADAQPVHAPALAFESALTAAVLHYHPEAIRELIAQRFASEAKDTHALRALEGELETLLKKYYARLLHIEAPALRYTGPESKRAQHYMDAFSTMAEQHHQTTYAGYPELIRNTLTFLNAHLQEDIRLSDAAAYCNVNYCYLSYLFKKEIGIGINQYLNALRTHHCMRLMLLQDASAAQASELAGFRNVNHFYAVFKAVTGVSPTSFRKHPNAMRYTIQFSPLHPAGMEALHEQVG